MTESSHHMTIPSQVIHLDHFYDSGNLAFLVEMMILLYVPFGGIVKVKCLRGEPSQIFLKSSVFHVFWCESDVMSHSVRVSPDTCDYARDFSDRLAL